MQRNMALNAGASFFPHDLGGHMQHKHQVALPYHRDYLHC